MFTFIHVFDAIRNYSITLYCFLNRSSCAYCK